MDIQQIIKHFKLGKNIMQNIKGNNIITRFPPEPSGFMHIGHAYALLWNWIIAKMFGGIMILRFDNTNPIKSKKIYENNIIKNIQDLNIDYNRITYASDYFGNMIEYATRLIKEGNAYVDNTSSDIMQKQKAAKIESNNRNNSIEVNELLWNDMINGNRTDCVLRLKLDYKSDNLCLRDPIIYRHKKFDMKQDDYDIYNKYHIFPTYDFACPITDYLDGITCVFRSNEFIDRDMQYKMILNLLNLPIPYINNYKKIEFEEASCSKRKISALINDGIINSWSDPRLLTLDGLKKAGLVNNTIYEYCGKLGFTSATCKMKISSIWTLNKKIIDKIATRVFAIKEENAKTIKLNNNNSMSSALIMKFNRNQELGYRELIFDSNVIVNKEDLNNSDEITLMNYCNIIRINKNDNNYQVTNGNYKDTSAKISWIGSDSVKLLIKKYSYDLKLPVETINFLGELYFKNIKIGDIIQIYHFGYYICDSIDNDIITLNEIFTK